MIMALMLLKKRVKYDTISRIALKNAFAKFSPMADKTRSKTMDNSAVANSTLGNGVSKVRRVMLDIIIALVPAIAASIVFFGLKALTIIMVCVGTAVISEFVFNLICKKAHTVSDLSAAVTGLLLALSLPSGVTVWQCIVGAVFAIVIVKCAFGGLGYNIANPAVAARVMLIIAFPAIKGTANGTAPSLIDMLVKNSNGIIGEACAAALVLGGVYLLIRRVISWQIPVVYIAGSFLLSLALTQNVNTALYSILSGGLILGAIFMATDPVTSPKKSAGKIVFALGCALLTVLIRFYGSNADGATFFAVLFMNIICPYIDRMFEKKQKSEEVAE